MDDLETLRPEVAAAIRLFGAVIEELGLHDNYESALHVLCAELLRLADDCARLVDCINAQPPTRRSLIDRAERAEAELAESRETIKRLNRRVQVAEAGVAEKVKASGGSLGRALANAAASKAEAELAALKARIAKSQECGVVALCGGGASLSHEPYPSLVGKRVRLLVVEE